MQIEKFYKAQDIHKEVQAMKDVIILLDKPEGLSMAVLDKLHTAVKSNLQGKAVDTLKKELTKLIKQREKEFTEL